MELTKESYEKILKCTKQELLQIRSNIEEKKEITCFVSFLLWNDKDFIDCYKRNFSQYRLEDMIKDIFNAENYLINRILKGGNITELANISERVSQLFPDAVIARNLLDEYHYSHVLKQSSLNIPKRKLEPILSSTKNVIKIYPYHLNALARALEINALMGNYKQVVKLSKKLRQDECLERVNPDRAKILWRTTSLFLMFLSPLFRLETIGLIMIPLFIGFGLINSTIPIIILIISSGLFVISLFWKTRENLIRLGLMNLFICSLLVFLLFVL
jgi:hypothetical protein